MFLSIIGLLILGLMLIFLEMFVPGGIIGFIGTMLMGTGTILCFYYYGPSTGMAVLLGTCALVTAIVILFFRIFPYTAEGKWVIMNHTLVTAKGSHSETTRYQTLIGREGCTESKLRPAGIAIVDGERLDVVSEGDYLEENTRIRVQRVDGNRIVVVRV
jgi:membrane-bound serine protease (ClpP class)